MSDHGTESVERKKYAQWVLATSLLATFLTVVNSSAVNIAIPTLMQEFEVSIDLIAWIVTGYMLPYSVLMPMFGQLGDLFGRKTVFIIGLGVFLVGSLMASAAGTFAFLLAARVVQAIGASCVLPNGMALVTHVFPAEQRGRVLGVWGGVAAFGAVIGPTMGGYLVEFANWRAIFFINVPLGLLALLLCIFKIQEVRDGQVKSFDFGGALTLAVSIFSLMFAVTLIESFGLLSLPIILLLLNFVVFFYLFYRIEKGIHYPMVDFSLFRNRTFVAATIGGFIQMFNIYAIVLPIPIFLQNVAGIGTAQTGLYLVSYSLTQSVISPLGGWAADRFNKKMPAVLGMVLCALSFIMLSRMDMDTAGTAVITRLVVGGIGIGVMTSALIGSVIDTSPPEKIGVSSGLYNMIRFIGAVFSATILGFVLSARSAFYEAHWPGAVSSVTQEIYGLVHAFHDVFLLTAALSVLGVLVALQIRTGR